MLYTESDLEKSMDKIETIHFHQVLHVYCKWNIHFNACKYTPHILRTGVHWILLGQASHLFSAIVFHIFILLN